MQQKVEWGQARQNGQKKIGKEISGAIYAMCFGPAGGARTRKGAFALQINITWLVETEIAFSVEQQYFISTTAGQIEAKRACGFS